MEKLVFYVVFPEADFKEGHVASKIIPIKLANLAKFGVAISPDANFALSDFERNSFHSLQIRFFVIFEFCITI